MIAKRSQSVAGIRLGAGNTMQSAVASGLCCTAAAVVILVASGPPASAEHAKISALRAADRKSFTDAQIVDGFFKVALGAEYQIGKRTDRIRKYDGPVRVFVDSRAGPDRLEQVAAVIADIRARIQHLDIAMTEQRGDAQIVLTLVRNRDLGRTIREFYGRERARSIQRSMDPQCLSGFRRDPSYRIVRSTVISVVDAGEFIFYDCLYEELLQALGPINDTNAVPWTMFNDNVQKGFFDIYDQYLLNILYHPRIRPGMTAKEVRALLPQVLPEVRAWVAKANALPRP